MSVTRRGLLLLGVTIAAAGLLYGAISGYVRVTNDRGGTDFNVFYLAGRTVLDGHASELFSVYTARGPGYTYIYLPMFAILMAPLSSLPIHITAIVWSLLSLLMIGHSALILYRGYVSGSAGGPSLKRSYLIFLIAASVVFFSENLLLGQVHILLMYLIVLAWKYQRANAEWAAGCLIGAAAVLKLLPAVFGLYFLLTRQYRALASMLITGVLLVFVVPGLVIGFETNGTLVQEFYDIQIEPFVSGETTDAGIYARTAKQKTLNDQDLGALLMRHFTADHYFVEAMGAETYRFLNLSSLNTSSVRRVMFVCFAVLLLATTAIFFHRRVLIESNPDGKDLFFALFVLLSLLLSPRIRLAYLTVLMIPYGLLIRNVLIHSDEHTMFLSKKILALSVGSLLLFSLPLFRAMTVLYYGLVCLFIGLLKLLATRDVHEFTLGSGTSVISRTAGVLPDHAHTLCSAGAQRGVYMWCLPRNRNSERL